MTGIAPMNGATGVVAVKTENERPTNGELLKAFGEIKPERPFSWLGLIGEDSSEEPNYICAETNSGYVIQSVDDYNERKHGFFISLDTGKVLDSPGRATDPYLNEAITECYETLLEHVKV